MRLGLPKEGIDALCRLLPNSAARKALKALRFGPPSDDEPGETEGAPEGMLPALKAACPKLQLLGIWGMLSDLPPAAGDAWHWARLEDGGVRGTTLIA